MSNSINPFTTRRSRSSRTLTFAVIGSTSEAVPASFSKKSATEQRRCFARIANVVTVGFRGSPLFAEWRALVGPHFAEPPSVKHYANLFEPIHF
jgi:hypothetical protein